MKKLFFITFLLLGQIYLYGQVPQCPIQITGPAICLTSDEIVQQESTSCASIYSWNRNEYPYLPTSSDDPIVIRLNFIFVQDQSGGSNFQQDNTEHDAIISDMMSTINNLYSNMSPPNNWSLCRNINYDYSVIPNLKIQFVYEKIYLPFQDWSNHDKNLCPDDYETWFNNLDNAVAALPNYKPGINVYCTTNQNILNDLIINHTTTIHNTTGLACSQFPSYSNYGRTSRIHMPDFYTKWWWMKNIVPTDQTVNSNLYPYIPIVRSWDYITKGHTLAHEIGHSLDLYHSCVHYGLNQCPESLMNQSYQVSHSYLPATEVGNMYRAIQLSNVRRFVLENCKNSNPLVLTQNTTWDFDVKFYRDIIIEDGAILTITCNLFMSRDTKIIVNSGGKLIIDGGKVSADDISINWIGIEVKGNNSLAQTPESNQGVVEVINGGTIENAKIGIYAYQNVSIAPPFGGNITYPLGGGIIRVNDGNFINNELDIKMAPYTYTNPVTQKPYNQMSYIIRGNFETNNDLISTTSNLNHIELLGVYGLQIKGCTFSNTNNSLSTIERGTGIISNLSSVKIIPYCDPQNPTCVNEPNEFSGLFYGIKVNNQSGSLATITISENTFTNTYRSIFLSGTNNATVLLNNIQVPDQELVPAGQPDPGTPYGIYLNGGKGFRVEENTLWRPSSNGPELFNGARGIIVHKTGAVNNEVYKNTFTNLFLSEQAQCFNSGTDFPTWYGSNNPGADVGLKFFCNTSQTNAGSYDMWMGGQNYCTPNISVLIGAQRFGIAEVQGRANPGSIQYPFLPAGNRFSDSHLSLPTTATVDFDNGEAGWLEYWWDDLDDNGPDGWKPVRKDNVTNEWIDVNFDVCPTKISSGGTSLNTLYTNLNAAQVALNSSITLLNIWQNGGDADLGEEVATTQPWDVYLQFNNLLATSPYLDEAVLIEVIQNPGFTSLMVKLLMIANPHAVNSEAVMIELENRNPAMPQSYIYEIRSQPETSSQLQILKGNVAANNHLMSTISEEIKAVYRADNENSWAKDSLINFVSRKPGLYDKYELATIYLYYGQYTEMQNVLDNINFEMDEEMEADFNNFESLLNIAKTMNQNNLYEDGLSETEVLTLEEILEGDQPLTASLALSLLKRNNPQYAYSEPVYDVTQSSARMAHPSRPEALVSGIEPEFKLYPNPALAYTTLKYNCKYKKLSYSIIDVTGREIKTEVLKTIEDAIFHEVLVDLSSISSGTYYFVVKANNEILYTEKLIIAE